MALSSKEAVERLDKITSIEELKNLVNSIDIHASGALTVFYSGEYLDQQSFGDIARQLAVENADIRIIDQTEISRFLRIETNQRLKETLERVVGGNPLEFGTPSYNFLYGTEDANGVRTADGIWDTVSARFAQETVGEVRVLTSPRREYGVFALSELPVLLDNANVTAIDGIPREQLQMLNQSVGLDMVKHAVAVNAEAQMHIGGIFSGEYARYLSLSISELPTALQDAAIRDEFVQSLHGLDPLAVVNRESGLSVLVQGGEIAAVNGISGALNKIGYLGGLLSLMFVSAQASAAGTREEAEAIMKAWAVDAAASEVGALVASAAAGIAVAAFSAAVAPVALPVAAAITLGASLLGGFFGAEWAADFHDLVDSKEEQQRREILDRLSELYFGASGTIAVETLPGTDGNFFRIDPGFSPSSMRQAAEASIAWRYALVKLNPFVVPDANYAMLHNAKGELELFDAERRRGLTPDYLAARAEAMQTFVRLFEAGEVIRAGQPYPGGYDVHFLDAEMHGGDETRGAVLDLHYTSDFKEQRIFGGSGDDTLTGSLQRDMLFGADGNDTLSGRGGGDYLEGGGGDDTYVTSPGDRVFDHDGVGRVLFDGILLSGGVLDIASGAYLSEGGEYRFFLDGADLQVERIADGSRLMVSGFENGDLGIDLRQSGTLSPDPLPLVGTPDSEVLRGRVDTAVTDYARVNGYNLPDHIQGNAGRDWIYAWQVSPQEALGGSVLDAAPDDDLVEGGPDKDFIHGGAGNDRLYATVLEDAAAVISGRGAVFYGDASGQGDFLSGQGGDDEVYGSGLSDGLLGGDGDDLIYGGGGDDIIAGDWSAMLSVASMDPHSHDFAWVSVGDDGVRQLHLGAYNGGFGADRIHAGEGDDLVWGGAGDDVIHGEAGDDQLNGDMSGTGGDGHPNILPEFHGRDFIAGGEGHDAINGNGGSDVLFGNAGNDVIDGDFRVLIGDDALYLGADYLDGGDGDDILIGNGNADIVRGGDGDDDLFGDLDGLAAAYHGADVLYGGSGHDRLFGQGCGDVLFGGDGDDILYGDGLVPSASDGEDVLYGGAGADELSGGGGADRLNGGEGSDRLWGEAGNDRLLGGPGVDYLEGGAGADIYQFAPGDGSAGEAAIDTIVDGAGEGNAIEFSAHVAPEDLQFTLVGDDGDIVVHYSGSDAVYLSGGLLGTIEAVSFGGRSALPFHELIARGIEGAHYLEGGDGDDLVFGSGNDDVLLGGAGRDDLRGGAGADLLRAGAASDRLVGGTGDDTLDGGEGSDLYRFASGHGHDVIIDPDGYDILHFVDVRHSDIVFSEVDSDLILSAGGDSVRISAWRSGTIDRIRFADDAVMSIDDALQADPALGRVLTHEDIVAGTVEGGPGDDSFQVAANGVTLRGGAGDDTYYLTATNPENVVEDDSGNTTLVVDGEPSSVLVLNRVGDDLVLALDGVAFARVLDGLSNPPARVVTPIGASLAGDLLLSRINTGPGRGAEISPVPVNEDARWQWTVPDNAFVDPDDSFLRLTALLEDGSVLPGWLAFDPTTKTFSGTPQNDDVGRLAIRLVATDRGGLQAETHLQLEVLNTNDAPHLVSLPNEQSGLSGYRYQLELAGDLFDDVDIGDTLRYSATLADGSDLPGWLSLDPVTGILSGVPADRDRGRLDLVLSARDDAGASVSTNLSLTVETALDKTMVSATALAPVGELRLFDVFSVGDVDGDGYGDLVVHSRTSDGDGEGGLPSSGVRNATLLYYGQEGGWGQSAGRVSVLNDYGNASDGVRNDWDHFGDIYESIVMRPLGDIDDDGYSDLAINQIANGGQSLDIYFGGPGGFGENAREIPADDVTRIVLNEGDPSLWQNTLSALDVLDWNGDGRPDLLFGLGNGESRYVEAGTGMLLDAAQWKGQTLSAADLLASADLHLTDSGSGAGVRAVAAVGDINGDGRDDIYVDGNGERRFVFGQDASTAGIDLGRLGVGASVQVVAPYVGIYERVVPKRLGDVNGDGLDDVLLRSDQQGWVVFGSRTMPESLALGGLNGSDGFILGSLPQTYQYTLNNSDFGHGDVNGDGIQDIVIGSHAVSEQRDYSPENDAELPYGFGIAHVVFGRDGAFPSVVDLSTLGGSDGFTLATPFPSRPAPVRPGYPLNGMVQLAVADIDGDGLQDVVKTAVEDDGEGGLTNTLYTAYGRIFDPAAEGMGSEAADSLVIAKSGAFYMRGGDDIVRILADDQSVSVHTGSGNDQVVVVPTGSGSVDGQVQIAMGSGDDTVRIELPVGVSGMKLPGGGVRIEGGSGADRYVVSGGPVAAGSLTIDDRSVDGQRNSLVLGFGYTSSAVRLARGSLLLSFGDGGLEIHLENFDPNQVLEGPRDIDTFSFADGTVWRYEELVARGFDLVGSDQDDHLEGTSVADRLDGMAGNDVLFAGDGDDRLRGGTGDDRLSGGAGNDTYVAASGDGADALSDHEGNNTVLFDEGVRRDDVQFAQQSEDLLVRYGAQDSLLVEKWFQMEEGASWVLAFADGTSLGRQEIEATLSRDRNRIVGTENQDWLRGTAEDDLMLAYAGNDLLVGGMGDDRLEGGTGSDRLLGGAGDDVLVGGPGSDVLVGGDGSDEYRFARGDGADRIFNWSWLGRDGPDTLRFATDVRPDQLWFSRDGLDLMVRVIDSRDSVVGMGWYSHEPARIDRIVSGDGARITADQVERLVHAVAGFAVSDSGRVELSPAQQEEYATLVASHWTNGLGANIAA